MEQDTDDTMTEKQLRKRMLRFFFALDHFYENGLSEYWLQEMKHNRELIEAQIKHDEDVAADALQTRLKL